MDVTHGRARGLSSLRLLWLTPARGGPQKAQGAQSNGRAQGTPGVTVPGRPAYAQLKLKLMLIRSASTRLEATSCRSQLSNRITEPAVAG